MEKYKLIGIKKRQNKDKKDYYLAYVTLENDNSFDLLNILINEKQVQPLLDVINDNDFDISRYIILKYNSYQKVYNPVINYGL